MASRGKQFSLTPPLRPDAAAAQPTQSKEPDADADREYGDEIRGLIEDGMASILRVAHVVHVAITGAEVNRKA
jgi:hypothetical protein